jgi:hypothetical protein
VNVLLLTSHSIAEYDDLRMLADLGYDVFSIGAYTKPDRRATTSGRPCRTCPTTPTSRRSAGSSVPATTTTIRASSSTGPRATCIPAIVDWADAIIVHHFPEAWIAGQWDRIRDKRVIWRTCGQSDPRLEAAMAQARRPRDRPLFTQGAEPWELCG